MGVFATRAPFRPNPIGLTCVKLERIELTENGPVIHVLPPLDVPDGLVVGAVGPVGAGQPPGVDVVGIEGIVGDVPPFVFHPPVGGSQGIFIVPVESQYPGIPGFVPIGGIPDFPVFVLDVTVFICLLYTSPSPRDS